MKAIAGRAAQAWGRRIHRYEQRHHDVHDSSGTAVLYDAEMPGGSVRFAEFFRITDGRIAVLNLHYDGRDYMPKGGR